MKKIIISCLVLVGAFFLSYYIYSDMIREKTNYEYISFKQIPRMTADNEKIIVFVKQDGCMPCKLVEPIINDYAKNNNGIVYSVVENRNKDDLEELEKYNIKGTPTLIFYSKGKEIQRTSGGFTAEEFKESIEKVGF